MNASDSATRRKFIKAGGILIAASAIEATTRVFGQEEVKKKANKMTDLVDVLLQQHQRGRRLTDVTIQFATNQALKNPGDRLKLADSMRQFIRMYNPHEAREDTVLFPAFRDIVSGHEFDSL